jgi:hypothetical protein
MKPLTQERRLTNKVVKVYSLTSSIDLLESAKELEKSIDLTLRSTNNLTGTKSTKDHQEFLESLIEMEKTLTHS